MRQQAWGQLQRLLQIPMGLGAEEWIAQELITF